MNTHMELGGGLCKWMFSTDTILSLITTSTASRIVETLELLATGGQYTFGQLNHAHRCTDNQIFDPEMILAIWSKLDNDEDPDEDTDEVALRVLALATGHSELVFL